MRKSKLALTFCIFRFYVKTWM